MIAQDGTTVIAAVTASLVLVFTTESDQVDALVTLARSFRCISFRLSSVERFAIASHD